MAHPCLAALLVMAVPRAVLASEGDPAQQAPAVAVAAAQPPAAPMVRVQLADGQELHGRVVERDAERLVLELASGGRITLPAQVFTAVAVDQGVELHGAELWYGDPNRTRYLHSPSAMMLRQGEAYFSASELFFTTVTIGVTDHLTLAGGAVVPAWFQGDGFNFIAALKLGTALAPGVHVAAGAEALVLPGTTSSVGLAFAGITLGGPNAHLTLAGGPPFALSSRESDLGPLILAVSGALRVSARIALVTENWVVTRSQPGSDVDVLNALAVRFLGREWGADVGLIRVSGVDVPLPWLDFTWHFEVGVRPRG